MVELINALPRVRNRSHMPSLGIRCDALSDYEVWTAWTGKPADSVHAFGFAYTSSGSPWQAKIGTWDNCLNVVRGLCDDWAGYKLDWCIPLCTDSQNLASTTAGTNDAQINAMLDAMLAHNPKGKIYLRYGHEAGYPTAWPWSAVTASGATDFINAFRHVSDLVKAKSSRFVRQWCVSPYCFDFNNAEVDPMTFYPGDDYVDMIDVDLYVVGSDAGNARTFERMSRNLPYIGSPGLQYGVKYLADQARARGKRMGFSEVGFGSENPAMMADFIEFCADPANNVEHVGYWNKNAGTQVGGVFPFPCRLTPDGNNPYDLMRAVFLKDWLGIGAGHSEQPETSAWLARTNNVQTASRRTAYDKLVADLRKNGCLDVMDGLIVLSAADEEIARIGPITPGSFNQTVQIATGRLTKNGTLDFLADRGYAGDGSTGYLNTNFNLSTIGGQFSQNSAHLGVWSLDAIDNNGSQAALAGTATSNIQRNTSSRWVGRPNTSSTVTLTGAGQDAGHVLWNRTAADAWASYFNGAAAQSGTTASAAPASANLQIGGIVGTGYSRNRIAVVHWGGQLTVTTHLNQPNLIYQAVRTYLIAIGAVAP